MDPVSHVAFGRAVVALDSRGAFGAGAIAACMFGSLAPDIDAVFMPTGWDVYLRHHQGGTHSLIGSITCAALTATVVWAMLTRGPVRLRGRYPDDDRPTASPIPPGKARRPRQAVSFLRLCLAAWIGTAGHLLLDVISGADIRFFWPLGPPVALPLFAMADPWLGGVLALGLLALVLRPRNPGRTATGILVAIAILSAGKWALYARVREPDDRPGRAVVTRRAETEWGSLTRWVTYDATADVVEARRVDALTGTVTPLVQMVRALNDPLVVRSRELVTVQNFLAAHAVTFAIVVGTGGEGVQVLWSDLRYCGPLVKATAPWGPVDLGTASPLSCALWFGGEFDRSGLATASIVHVGHLVQRRALR
jgi:membrane-bound metal-dependent hydrolase YbcI (DUF457 family)